MQTEADIGGYQHILDDYLAAWNARDSGRIASLFTEDGRYGEFGRGRVLNGRPEIAAYLRDVISAVPDLRLTLCAHPVYTGDRIFFKWTMRGTRNSASVERFPAGMPFELRGAAVLVFEGDKISRAADSFEVRNAGDPASQGLHFLSKELPFPQRTDPLSDDSVEDNIWYGE